LLQDLCEQAGTDFGISPSKTRALTRFATKSRYPDDVYDFTDNDAELDLKYSAQVLSQAKAVLENAKKKAGQDKIYE